MRSSVITLLGCLLVGAVEVGAFYRYLQVESHVHAKREVAAYADGRRDGEAHGTIVGMIDGRKQGRIEGRDAILNAFGDYMLLRSNKNDASGAPLCTAYDPDTGNDSEPWVQWKDGRCHMRENILRRALATDMKNWE